MGPQRPRFDNWKSPSADIRIAGAAGLAGSNLFGFAASARKHGICHPHAMTVGARSSFRLTPRFE